MAHPFLGSFEVYFIGMTYSSTGVAGGNATPQMSQCVFHLQDGEWGALEALFTYHGKVLLPHRYFYPHKDKLLLVHCVTSIEITYTHCKT